MAATMLPCSAAHGLQTSFRGNTAGFTAQPRLGCAQRGQLQVMGAGLKELKSRIGSIGNTKKITDAMKLVAAAKVRRAQDAVINGRPFAENLVKVLFGVNQRLRVEDVDSPLIAIRPVKAVLVVLVTGDRGLCGGYNSIAIRKAENRVKELQNEFKVDVKLVTVGKKGSVYFRRRSDKYNLVKTFELGQNPTTREAQAIADELYSDFVSEEVDKVEMVFTKFQSLIASDPVVQTMLPLTPAGEICDVNGACVDPDEDELFNLTTKGGKLEIERKKVKTDTADFDAGLIFEQDPVQIIDALLPLYLNATLLRALQESLASELAARMNAMNSASDNAKELKKNLSTVYNRKRQAKITSEIIEITAGADAA